MRKVIEIGDKEIEFESSAYLPIMYREECGREFFEDLQNMQSDITGAGFKIAYCMYKHANDKCTRSIKDFLKGFEIMDLVNAIPDLVELAAIETKTEPKKKEES